MAILEGLNERQKEAVMATRGQLLIVAGAGSGKTKTITHRIAYLINQGVRPDKILAVTFTNKAAGEMKERVYKLLKEEQMHIDERPMPFIGTFHALGAFILRNHGSEIGIPKRFSILDEEDVRSLIKDLIREFELDPDVFTHARVRGSIHHLKNELMTADIFAREHEQNPYQMTLSNLYTAYDMRLSKIKGVDFDDLILKPVMLFESSESVRAFYKERWSHIHVDEYQDTNRAQYALSRYLASHGNIAVVGDVDQAIYSWRGADSRNMLQFELDWPEAKVILLEDNYRSTKTILEVANAVIVNNKERKEKTLRSTKGDGEPLTMAVLENEKQEAAFIVEYIKFLSESGIPRGEIAVLFRTNAQSRAIEEAFLKNKIPYRLIAGVKFYERKEIKDVLGYLKYALNENDIISQKRILNTPARGIGKVSMLKYLGKKELGPKEKEKIAAFESIITKLRTNMQTKSSSEVIKALLKDAGFEKSHKENKLDEDKWENIKELVSVATKFDEQSPPEGIETLLTEAALATQETEVEDKNSQVVLLTAHAAKGLEFDAVIIAGMEEGLFPHSLSQTPSELEEERRLFYVALTRAREKIALTLAERRTVFGEVSFNDPSRFLSEIPKDLATGVDLTTRNDDYEEDSISIW